MATTIKSLYNQSAGTVSSAGSGGGNGTTSTTVNTAIANNLVLSVTNPGTPVTLGQSFIEVFNHS